MGPFYKRGNSEKKDEDKEDCLRIWGSQGEMTAGRLQEVMEKPGETE